MLPSPRRGEGSKQRRALVLLAVLVVVVILSLAAYQFSALMTSEYRVATNTLREAQAKALAESGVHFAAAVLSNPKALEQVLGNNPFENTTAFQGKVILESKLAGRGMFSILAANEDGSVRAGVSDEGGKINVNAIMKRDPTGKELQALLVKLQLPEDIANSIVDWLDEDDQPRSNGAENETYSQLGYRCKNGPLDSLEELLLVKGVTPELLFGTDRNRNGMLDQGEGDGFNPGLAAFLTVYSREQNIDSEGYKRTFINDADLQKVYTELSQRVGAEMATYIALYRTYGPAKGTSKSSGGGAKGSSRGGTSGLLNLRAGGKNKIGSLFDLVGSVVSVPGPDKKSPPTYYPSPLNTPAGMDRYFSLLLDFATTSQDEEVLGRININTAAAEVIKALPYLTAQQAQTVIDNRPKLSELQSAGASAQILLLLYQSGVTVATLKKLEPFITTRTQVYRVQALGYFENDGPRVRLEAVIDTNAGRPRVLHMRDLSALGQGFPLTQ